ncbi:MAG: hypothetical protein R3F36_14280 [Candidatus Competibacteraceae bacterium]
MAGHARGDYQAQNVNSAYPGTFERDFTDTNGFSLQWRYAFTPDDELLFSLAHDRVHHGDPGFSSAAVIPGVVLNVFQFEEEREEVQLQYARNFSGSMAGGDRFETSRCIPVYYLNTDRGSGDRCDPDFRAWRISTWENLVFNLGAMIERAPIRRMAVSAARAPRTGTWTPITPCD